MLGSTFIEKEKKLNKIGWFVRGDLIYGNYIVGDIEANGEGLKQILCSLVGTKGTLSADNIGRGKIRLTISRAWGDFINEEIIDGLINNQKIYSEYMYKCQ